MDCCGCRCKRRLTLALLRCSCIKRWLALSWECWCIATGWGTIAGWMFVIVMLVFWYIEGNGCLFAWGGTIRIVRVIRDVMHSKRSMWIVLDYSIEAKIADMFFHGVCCIPCTTLAFCTKIPCFVVVLPSGVWIFWRIFDPSRNILGTISVVFGCIVVIRLACILRLGHQGS